MARSILASVLLFVTLLVGITSCNGQGTGVAANCSTSVQLNITGDLVCNSLPIPIPGPSNSPLVGVTVNVSCDGGMTTIGTAMTNSMGFFQIMVNGSNLNLSNLTNCRAMIQLPVTASCPLLPVEGSLRAPLRLIGIIQIAGNIIVNIVIGVFVFVP